jgi:DNA polymerase-3 subunit epsilon
MSPVRSFAQRSFDDLGTPLADVTFCVIDLETTGGAPNTDRITEIGAVKVRGGEFLGTFQTMINPGQAIPPIITVLTGITDSMVAKAPRVESVLPSLLEFIGGSVIVGHNVGFDIGFLNAALAHASRPPLPRTIIDTCALARRLVRDEVPNCKLGTLSERFRLDHRPTHRALDDALATTDLLHLLIERASAFGVTGLDDLVALPKIGSHPQAAKLRHTDDLPRCPGVYLFHGHRDEVLYIGKATNLRQRVRSYFGAGESRRKVGNLLREVHRISHITTPDPVTAAVVELRLLQRHLPRYNRQFTTAAKYCYVKLSTEEAFPRLSIAKEPTGRGTYLGPMSSRAAAQLVIEAVQSAIPLRRCTQRIGRRGGVIDGLAPCTAAQLGVASCPCSGTTSADAYARIAAEALLAITRHPELVLGPLQARMAELAGSLRFEEAAAVRDRAAAFAGAVRRQRLAEGLRGAGALHVRAGDVDLHIERGRLVASGAGLPMPIAVELDGVASPDELPPARHEIDEMLVLARSLCEGARRPELVECHGTWAMPALPAHDPLPLRPPTLRPAAAA